MKDLIIKFNDSQEKAEKLVDHAFQQITKVGNHVNDDPDEDTTLIDSYLSELRKQGIYSANVSFNKERLKLSVDKTELQ